MGEGRRVDDAVTIDIPFELVTTSHNIEEILRLSKKFQEIPNLIGDVVRPN